MRRLLLLLVVAATLLFCGCTPSAGYTTDPDISELLAEVWGPTGEYYYLQTGINVTYHMGNPPAGYGAWTQGHCFLWWCFFDVTIGAGYLTREVVAHEGGHVVCATEWFDWSEACADGVASWVLGTSP